MHFMKEDHTDKDILNLAEQLDITLDETQLNVGGERAIMSPDKWVLTGTKNDSHQRVVLKCAKDAHGVAEIDQEHTVRNGLKGLPFAEQELIMPDELFYGKQNGYTVSVNTFIEQDNVFTDHSLHEQFFMALHALESQESFHATTREHQSSIRNQFQTHSPDVYLDTYKQMGREIKSIWPDSTDALEEGLQLLEENQLLLQAYDGYLIHSDFVPHNFRIHDQQLYLLDFVSFRLGNKYESWARFINFMEIHSPNLVSLLLDYIKQDRGKEEYQVLKLMRIYKIVFLLNYYTKTYTKTEGNLHELTKARLIFWSHILKSILADSLVDTEKLEHYYNERSRLRTPEEKERQKQFTWS